MIFVSVIWNYFEEIPHNLIFDVADRTRVGSVELFRLNENLSRFIKRVYEIDNLDTNFIKLKIEALEKSRYRNVIVIIHEINSSNRFYDNDKKKYISKEAQIFKNELRKEFNVVYGCDENYPIIHTTDNEWEAQQMKLLIQDFRLLCLVERIL